jgi:hypothetical protein
MTPSYRIIMYILLHNLITTDHRLIPSFLSTVSLYSFGGGIQWAHSHWGNSKTESTKLKCRIYRDLGHWKLSSIAHGHVCRQHVPDSIPGGQGVLMYTPAAGRWTLAPPWSRPPLPWEACPKCGSGQVCSHGGRCILRDHWEPEM